MDTEALRQHLTDTPLMVERHRARLEPGGPTVSDEPVVFSGFGPKSPCNEVALQAADSEAAATGELAAFCMRQGTIPRHPLSCLWRPGGNIRGVLPSRLGEFRGLVSHMKHHAAAIVSTPGVDWNIWLIEEVRQRSLNMFPQEDSNWVSVPTAMEISGRGRRTIQSWVSSGGVRSVRDSWGVMVHAGDIRTKVRLIAENIIRNADSA